MSQSRQLTHKNWQPPHGIKILDYLKKHGRTKFQVIARKLNFNGTATIYSATNKLERDGLIKITLCECGNSKYAELKK